jgi:hypothetical protein
LDLGSFRFFNKAFMMALSRWTVVLMVLQRVDSTVNVLAPRRGSGPVAARSQRSLEISAAEREQAEDCKAAVDAFRQDNPELNQTFATFTETWNADYQECLALVDPSANPITTTCDVDGLKYEDGALYDTLQTACADAGGLFIEFDTTVNCTDEDEGVTIYLNTAFRNYPRCMLSEDVEPSCDLEVYGRFVSVNFEEIGNCTVTTSLADSSPAETPPSALGGDTPAPTPEPAPTGSTPPAPAAEDTGATPTVSTSQSECSRVFGSLGFRSTPLAMALLAFVAI